MKKKIIIISGSVLIAIVLIAIILFSVIPTEDLFPFFSYTNENFITTLKDEDNLDENLPTVVLFHSKMCKSCIEFRPHFKKLAKKYKGKYNFAELDIQNPENYPLSAIHGMSVPNLYIFDPSIGNKVHISLLDAHTIKGIEFELDRYLRIRSFIDLPKAQEEHTRLFNEYQTKLQKAQK